MTDEKMDEMIRRTAASYNAPPASVPRDEMWAAIQARRAAGPRIIYGSGAKAAATASPSRVWWGAAAAAVLLVGAGVGIGRWSAAPAALVAPRVKTVAVETPVVVAPPVTESPTVSVPTGTEPSSEVKSVRVASSREHVRADFRPGPPRAVAGAPAAGSSAAYQMATLTHLSNAEAMLTAFRSHADEKMDAAMSKWARDLLTNTRLLLDSPAADDPHRKQLLEDLELTLVDIVQLSPNAGAGDRKMIEKSLDQGRVLSKLRTAIPAGMQKGS